MPALDLDQLKEWIGRTADAEDIVTPRLVAEYRATFDPHLGRADPAEAPLGLHWLLSPAIVPMSEIGLDGHPQRGGFLPPVPLPRRMWAGGEVEMRAPLRIGDTVTRRSRIEDVSAKQGRSGTLCFVAVRHEYHTGRGLAVSERHDIVYREAEAPKPAGTSPPDAPQAPRDEAGERHRRGADLTWTVETSPVLLFRYSAMTFNGHRIHYDLPYVTGEEGYPGLVVHGPIQATLLLNMSAILAGGRPGRFGYRGLSPVTAGEPMTVSGRREPDGSLYCWTESRDGRPCMEARVEPPA